MFDINIKTIIYIACPAGYASGGPELLHQLCASLCKKGVQAKMLYQNIDISAVDPTPPTFLHYGTAVATAVQDSPDNILIVPEIYIGLLSQYSAIKKCIWWLGANHPLVPSDLNAHKYIHFVRALLMIATGMTRTLTFRQIKRQGIICLAQCWYTVFFLARRKIHNVAYLSDYISPSFIDTYLKTGVDTQHREDLILYNPKRNTKYVQKLIAAAPELHFVPIINMSPDEVIALMQKAKIYIDFGSHPGKDRIPREAVLCGCCVLTSTLGSANYFNDVPILSSYKYERKHRNIPAVLAQIREVMQNYSQHTKDFDVYRAFILNEPAAFEDDIASLFLPIAHK